MAHFLIEHKDLCAAEEERYDHETNNEETAVVQSSSVRLDNDSTPCPCGTGDVNNGWSAFSADKASASSSLSSCPTFLLPMLKLKDLTLTQEPCSSSIEGNTSDSVTVKDACYEKIRRTPLFLNTSNYCQYGDRDSSQFDASLDESDVEGSLKSANDRDPVNIFASLYLGNAAHASDLETLNRYNIKYILNVTSDLPNQFETGTGLGDANSDFKYLRIPIDDIVTQNLAAYFPMANEFIDEAIEKKCGILVHCLAGVSRSVTFTVAYLMKSKSFGMDDAYDLVKKRKPNIEPNFCFMRQLLDYERSLSRSDGGGDVTPDSAVSSLSTSSSSICIESTMIGQ